MINLIDLKNKLICGLPYYIEDFGNIYAPTLKDIAEFNEEDFFNITNILTADKSSLEFDNDFDIDSFNYFDYIFFICDNDEYKKYLIIKYLELIIKEKITFLKDKKCFFIGEFKDGIPSNKVKTIDCNNFHLLQSILRIQNSIKIEDTTKTKTKENKTKSNKRLDKLKKKRLQGRKRLNEAKGESFSILVFISSLSAFILDIDKVISLNFFQADDLYTRLIRKEKYSNNYKALLAGANSKELDLKHWSTNIIKKDI